MSREIEDRWKCRDCEYSTDMENLAEGHQKRTGHLFRNATLTNKPASLPASQEPRTELLEELLAGCLRFMESEMQWEFFRSEMFESDNKQSISYRNGVKLQEFLRRPEYVQIWDDLKQKGLIKSR